MLVTLAGKVAVVTGAASGIGRAIVRKYLESDVAGLVAVDVQAGLASTMAEDNGEDPRLRVVVGDVGREETAVEFTDVAVRSFGRVDVMVNNAGVALVKKIHEHTPEDWDRVMNTNVKAVYWSSRHVVPVMMGQGGGVILNTGSISGQVGLPGQGAYGPSKGALHLITRQMAVDYGPVGIRVNAIGCGTVDTPIVAQSAAESGDADGFWKMLRDGHPIGRVATADEIASFFVYMASDLASFFTGSILMIDGGYTAR